MTKFNPYISNLFSGSFDKILIKDVLNGTKNIDGQDVGSVILDPSRDYKIDISWELRGVNVPLWIGHMHTEKKWIVTVYAESIGPGSEFILYHDSVAAKNMEVSELVRYHCVADIVAGAMSSLEHIPTRQSGMFKLIVTVFLNNVSDVGLDIVGFSDETIIQVEDPR